MPFKYIPGSLQLVLKTDPRADAYTKRKAVEITEAAKADFIRQQRKDNEWRISETTPPKYIGSFGVRKVATDNGVRYDAYNDDPAVIWIEYGAHAGGETPVLRYKPLTHGLEFVAGMEAAT